MRLESEQDTLALEQDRCLRKTTLLDDYGPTWLLNHQLFGPFSQDYYPVRN